MMTLRHNRDLPTPPAWMVRSFIGAAFLTFATALLSIAATW
jgi:hypothetical protein